MVITDFELDSFSREASGRFQIALPPVRRLVVPVIDQSIIQRQVEQARCRADAYANACRIERWRDR